MREAKDDLVGIAIYDRLDKSLPHEPNLVQMMWRRRELENYLCQKETLLAYAEAQGRKQLELYGPVWRKAMGTAISEIEQALLTLGKPSPWGEDIKANDDFLDGLFRLFFDKVGLPNLMRKSDYHTLAPFVPENLLDNEIREKLDAIEQIAARAKPRT